VVVKGDFSEIIPPLTGEKLQSNRSRSISRQELIRETIHIGGFFVPIVSFYLLNRYTVTLLIFLVTSFYVLSELARMQGFNVPITSTITLNAAIKPEMYEFVTAPIFYAIGIMSALTLIPEPTGYASITILTLGDGFAMLLGKKFGRHVFSYNKGKRVEGTVFGFLFAFMGASLFVSPLKALLGAAAGMFIESLPAPVSDNLTIPIISGLIMVMMP
jgi:dolichol kinase